MFTFRFPSTYTGFIDQLLSGGESSAYLLRNFVFYIVPMLNPDGVCLGNYRTSLSGDDLNRQWRSPDQHLHPEIYAAKALLTRVNAEHEGVS